MSEPARAMVTSLAGVWDRFWFRPIPPHVYALLRITLGVSGLLSVLDLSDSALWNLDGGLIADYGIVTIKSALRGWGLGAEVGSALYLACVVVFVAMTVGFKSRVAVPAALVSQLLESMWNSLPLSGSHQLMEATLFCLMWGDTGAVWSLDAWLARRRRQGMDVDAPQLVSIAPLRMLQFQIALVYLSAGLWKLDDPFWRDGSAVHYVLNNNQFHRFPNIMSPSLDALATLATYTTVFWELSFAFMVCYAPTRRLVLVLGMLMHSGMIGLMEVGTFHLVMLAAYPAFLDPRRIARLAPGRTEDSVAADIVVSP